MTPNRTDESETMFLNVDLDIRSRVRLEPLVAALGEQVYVLYVGPEGKGYGAHLELAGCDGKDADAKVRALAALVSKLPRTGRKLWQQAQSREFNIGIQAGVKPYCFELRLKPETLDSVARVAGRVVVTVYAADAPSGDVGRGRDRVDAPDKRLQRTAQRTRGRRKSGRGVARLYL